MAGEKRREVNMSLFTENNVRELAIRRNDCAEQLAVFDLPSSRHGQAAPRLVAVIDIYRKEEKLVVREVGSIEPDRTIMHPTPDAIKAQRLADLLWTETEDLRVQPIEWTRLEWFYGTVVGQAFEPHRPDTAEPWPRWKRAA